MNPLRIHYGMNIPLCRMSSRLPLLVTTTQDEVECDRCKTRLRWLRSEIRRLHKREQLASEVLHG